jgi:hypothetical protein
MAFTFNSNPANKAFGKAKKVGYASDYLENKKLKLAYCEIVTNQSRPILYRCNKLVRANSFETLYLFNRAKLNNNIPNVNLEVNLYTKENCATVNVIEGTPPSAGPFPQPIDFTKYRVDPCGELFGNSQCGVGNFIKYLELNALDLCNLPKTIEYAPPELYPSSLNCYPRN